MPMCASLPDLNSTSRSSIRCGTGGATANWRNPDHETVARSVLCGRMERDELHEFQFSRGFSNLFRINWRLAELVLPKATTGQVPLAGFASRGVCVATNSAKRTVISVCGQITQPRDADFHFQIGRQSFERPVDLEHAETDLRLFRIIHAHRAG